MAFKSGGLTIAKKQTVRAAKEEDEDVEEEETDDFDGNDADEADLFEMEDDLESDGMDWDRDN